MSRARSSAFEEFEEFIEGEAGLLDEPYQEPGAQLTMREGGMCRCAHWAAAGASGGRLIRLPEYVHDTPTLAILW